MRSTRSCGDCEFLVLWRGGAFTGRQNADEIFFAPRPGHLRGLAPHSSNRDRYVSDPSVPILAMSVTVEDFTPTQPLETMRKMLSLP